MQDFRNLSVRQLTRTLTRSVYELTAKAQILAGLIEVKRMLSGLMGRLVVR